MPARNTKSIALMPHWGQWIDDLVDSGEYQSASEVVRDGLRALRDGHDHHAAQLTEIRARIRKSLDAADSGTYAQGSGEDAVVRAFESARTRTTP
ncbi:MAG: type II toxin-antitoxin system ParD family antitoxin [Robiginitomaculum sp.]|nr:MAG: type II toxin-antitoxin system ParD family antitoxin [Robiginitomaculum sp.]